MSTAKEIKERVFSCGWARTAIAQQLTISEERNMHQLHKKEEKEGACDMKKLTKNVTQGGLPAHESPFKLPQEISTYTELRQQIHHDLRIQHPEGVQRNGESPVCDFYEARLMDLLHFDAKGLN